MHFQFSENSDKEIIDWIQDISKFVDEETPDGYQMDGHRMDTGGKPDVHWIDSIVSYFYSVFF